MRYWIWILSVMVLALSASAEAIDVRISVTEVSDRRTTGQFFNNLEIKLKLVGDDVADIKGIRTALTTAVDDAGRNLLMDKDKGTDFETRSDGGQSDITLTLKNPARRATAVREITGELLLFMPTRDPSATILIKNISKIAGKPIANPALEKAGIGMTVLTKKEYEALKKDEEKKAKDSVEKQGLDQAMVKAFEGLFSAFFQIGENDLILKVADPSKKLIEIEVVDAKGAKISNQGSMKSGDIKVLNYSEALPVDAQLRLFLKTAKTIVSVPLRLTDIALP